MWWGTRKRGDTQIKGVLGGQIGIIWISDIISLQAKHKGKKWSAKHIEGEVEKGIIQAS